MYKVLATSILTLYQPMTPMTHICVMSSHKPIRIYMGGLILGVNTLYRLFCFFKLFPMVDKGLIKCMGIEYPTLLRCPFSFAPDDRHAHQPVGADIWIVNIP